MDRSARSELVWSRPAAANAASNWLAFVITPLAAGGLMAGVGLAGGATGRGLGEDYAVIAEASMLAMNVNQLVKFMVARHRPFAHQLSLSGQREGAEPADDHLSFFSGHTTWVFALATSASTVASLRGYRAAPALWATTVPLAALTGYLRMGADKHYLSDVLVGALVGTAFGVGVPLLAHGRSKMTPSGSGDPIPAARIELTSGVGESVAPTFSLSGIW